MLEIQNYEIVIVGSGLFGLTMARKIVESSSKQVLVLEKRNHIGGNSYSYEDPETGIDIHKYGSHLFHTSNQAVWEYLNRFSEFSNYNHTVWTMHKGIAYSLPVNLSTIQSFFGNFYTPQKAFELIHSSLNEINSEALNFEDKAISLVGRPLYEAFIKNYTQKQWQTDPKLLPPEIISRLPVRYNFNNRYFNDKYEGIPIQGYGNMIQKIAKHSQIDVLCSTDFFKVKKSLKENCLIIYTGPLDEYFDYKLGKLSWSTLDFELEKLDISDFQGTSVMNYADLDVPYTRIHEFKHFDMKKHQDLNQTIIMKEFSRFATAADEPYYPVNSSEDRKLLEGYRQLVKNEKNTVFGGRLGSYQYLDMHMAIASAFAKFDSEVFPRLEKESR